MNRAKKGSPVTQKIEPLQPPWKNLLLNKVKHATKSIFIITPILKIDIIKLVTNLLLDSPPAEAFQLKIMTRLNEEEIIDGRSDLEALELLSNLELGPKFKLEFRGIENLNANVLIFDDSEVILTTGGLSNPGLISNLEYGLHISDQELVKKIVSDFNDYWSAADGLKTPDLKYFISQIQEHDTSVGGFLKLGSSIQPHGQDLEDLGIIDGETLAKKYVSKARDHEDMGEYEATLEYYNKALVATPNNIDIVREKAVLLRDELKRPEEALAAFNKILTIEPEDEQASLESGIILVKTHKYWDALIKLDITTSTNPGNESAWFWKSKVLFDTSGRKKDALRCLDEVIKIDPNNEDAWHLKGKILCEHLSRFSEADRCFNTVTRINPKNERAWIDKGKNLLKNLNKPLDAIKSFDKVTKFNKENPFGWFFKGKVLTEAYNKDSEAYRCFSEALRIKADYKDALYYQGRVLYSKLSKPKAAKEQLEKLLELGEYSDVFFELALLHSNYLDDSKKALVYFLDGLRVKKYEEEMVMKPKNEDDVIKFDDFAKFLKYLDGITISEPDNSKAWYEKGAILDRIYSRFEDAIKCLDEATRLNLNFKDAWYDKAVILSTVYGRNKDAIKCLNKAISLDKKDESIWYVKGKALMDEQKYEDALACFEKVIKINPKNKFAFENIANSLISLSRLKEAIEYFDKGIELDNLDAGLWYEKGNTFLSLRNYPQALNCYKNALNINPNHDLALKNFEIYSDKENWV